MLRWIAYLFLAFAAGIFVTDLASGITSGKVRLAALGEWWAWLHRDSLLLLQPAVERHLSPVLWDPGIQTLLEWPAALEFAALGGLLWCADRWRRRRRARAAGRASPQDISTKS